MDISCCSLKRIFLSVVSFTVILSGRLKNHGIWDDWIAFHPAASRGYWRLRILVYHLLWASLDFFWSFPAVSESSVFHLAPGGYLEHLDALLLLTFIALQVIIIFGRIRLFLGRPGTCFQLRCVWGVGRLLRLLVRDGDKFSKIFRFGLRNVLVIRMLFEITCFSHFIF